MNTRFASAVAAVAAVAAVVLSVGTMASPALAQSYTAPAGISAAAAPGSHEARSYDDITTGSIGYGRDYTSAQQGNAEQNNFPVWQFGRTSGGTAR